MTAIPQPPFPTKGVTIVRGLCPLHVFAAPTWSGPAEEL